MNQAIEKMNEKQQKISSLARDILNMSRNQIVVNLRFLDSALGRLELREAHNADIDLAVDGKFVYYAPMKILKSYKFDRWSPVRDYLHVLFHCIFQHMFVEPNINREIWNLACDIVIENVISGLGVDCSSLRKKQQEKTIGELKTEIGNITAEKVYRYYLDKNLSSNEAAKLRGLFYADNHEIWYMTEEEKSAAGLGGGEKESDEIFESENSSSSKSGAGDAEESDYVLKEVEMGSAADWEKVSRSIQMDLETFSKQHGDTAGDLVLNLRELNREKYDYSEFLKKFAVLSEVMQINDEEFDYVYYNYGLELYGNMPLIEPLEYKDVKRIRDFVIAIDTSGSVMGETVQRFIEKTYNILKTENSFCSRINLHIIQCDAEIQEVKVITSQREFEDYIKSMKFYGFGGTDFRPVFDYLDKLVENGELRNLKGMIYFTDGYGAFPKKMPKYKTAFVFLDDEYNNYDVPPWAIKLILTNDDINTK